MIKEKGAESCPQEGQKKKAEEVYPWERPYTVKPQHDVLAIIREGLGRSVDIRPVITPVSLPPV
ncbi:MAG: hypothetical protein FJY77_06085, partial [Candidatus Altiarchaeales archaeon]|nr:hypothetical protein [Candidatus Altiarchaeales archaeon]